MALEAKISAPALHLEFETGYVRILSLVLESGDLRCVVGAYPSAATREAQKQKEDLLTELSEKQGASRLAETDYKAVVAEYEHKQSEGYNFTEEDKQRLEQISQAYVAACKDEDMFRESVIALPDVLPLYTQAYTFPLDLAAIEKKSVLKHAYDLLKTVPEFKDAKNI